MKDSGFSVAIVGTSSLKGKELKETIEETHFPVRRLTLLDEDDLIGQLTEFQGEPTFVRNVDQESFRDVDFAFFASSPLFTRNYWKLAQREGCRVIDLTEAIEEELPETPLGAPLVTGSLPPGDAKVVIAAHPAAMVIARVLRRLAERMPLASVVVNVFEPASERGAPGIEELHQQTVKLLSFHEWPREIFDAQVAFNLGPAYGEGARPSLLDVEKRIIRETGKLLEGSAPAPSVRLAQSGNFHAYSFSFHLRFAEPHSLDQVETALSGEGFDLRGKEHEPPTAVGAASSNEILVGDIRPDPAAPGSFWLWASADNMRLMALNAVKIAEELGKSL